MINMEVHYSKSTQFGRCEVYDICHATFSLKGQSSEQIFWAECKNLFVIGPVLGSPNIFDFGLLFEEIFVFENRLPSIVYFRELMLCISFTTQNWNSPSRLLCGVVRNNLFFQ